MDNDTSVMKPYAFRFKNQTQVLSNMIDTFMSTNQMINDFTNGSISRSLLESVSIEMEQLYYLTIENMEKAIDSSVTSAFGFTAQEATYAYGQLLITFNEPLYQDMYVPQGARFYSKSDSYNQVFRTLEPYRLPAGSSSYTITVYCTETGSQGNVPSGVINATNDLNGFSYVTNPQAFLTGKDKESPEQEKERFRRMIASLEHGTRNSIEYAVKDIDGVQSCYVYEDNFGEVIIYACDANGDLPDDLREQVIETVSLYKVAGVRFIVRPVHKSYVNLSISVSVNDKLLKNQAFLDLIKNTVEQYVDHFDIGEYLHNSEIINQVMNVESLGITDCNVTSYVSTDEQLDNDSYISDGSPTYIGNSEVYQNQLIDPNIYQDRLYGEIGLPNYQIDEKGVPTWETALSANYVLNSGFHKEDLSDWVINVGKHDRVTTDDSLLYGNSNSLVMNVEDDGYNNYRYVETNRIPVNQGEIYSARVDLRASQLYDKGFALMMLYNDYDKQSSMIPVPVQPSDAQFNLLSGTSDNLTECKTQSEYGNWNTVNLGGEQPYIYPEPNLQSGATYTYSVYTNNIPCDTYVDVVIHDNQQNKDMEFKGNVQASQYCGTQSCTFTVPTDFNVNSISLSVKSVQSLGDTPVISNVQLKDEKLEDGGSVTTWYLSQKDIDGKPQYVYNNVSVTGTSDMWQSSAWEGVTIPKGFNTLSLRMYVQSFGVLYVAQPQINKSSQIAPFRISEQDATPEWELPYTDFFELKDGKYITAPNEILRVSNIKVNFEDDNSYPVNIKDTNGNIVNQVLSQIEIGNPNDYE